MLRLICLSMVASSACWLRRRTQAVPQVSVVFREFPRAVAYPLDERGGGDPGALTVADHDFAVDEDMGDVAAARGVCERGNHVEHRSAVRTRQVDRDQVAALAHLERTH